MANSNIDKEVDHKEVNKHLDELEGSDRTLFGWMAMITLILAVSMSLFHLYTAGIDMLPRMQQNAIHLGFALMLIFLIFPYKKKLGQKSIPWYDIIFAIMGASVGIYIVTISADLVGKVGNPNTMDTTMSFIAILLVLEATRRVVGKPLVIIAAVFMLYAWLGDTYLPSTLGGNAILPDVLNHFGFSWNEIAEFMFLSNEGIFGTPITVSAQYVFIFILFGAFLEITGAGRMFIDLAVSLVGSFKGGPAKAAVISSGMMGSISGSSVANAVTTGTFTIPLMKKTGFRPKVAGGVEVAASSSGQLLPPVMGAAAFIMADFTGIPYLEIAASAAIPALLTYTAILFMVHLEASKFNLKGIPRKDLVSPLRVIAGRGYLLLPIVAIIVLLIMRFTPIMASFMAIIGAISISLFSYRMQKNFGAGFLVALLFIGGAYAAHLLFGLNEYVTMVSAGSLLFALIWYALGRKVKSEKQTKFGLREIISALELGAKNSLSVVAACATAGILTGVVTMTGLGPTFSSLIIGLANNELILVLVFTMVACIIMGLGLPTTATYIVLAAVMAPALIQVGVPVLAAHLFVFYYGILADDTPPINLPAYATSGIAKSDPVQTGIQGFKFDMGALLLPYAFVLNPMLILQDDTATAFQITISVATAFIGIIAWSTFIQSYLFTKFGWTERILAVAAALVLLNADIWTDILGIAIFGLIVVIQWRKSKRGNKQELKSA
ncbi:TRAP transporter 4TM/12TM fusion protein [Virgibacillus natechei]|uniref:TRAP transporter 4TM/12TM fusion protein n=1 Tax=Virgibacillus natechei TaxID=1216297 RepID=A0ABS4IJ16_9BACI|nr:TRAP transporter permease [Virgibacillus natechei]MBP1970960.1 TRAP transporter 4TM/12TM fusion protein [Virgibacillus natechei]UZD12728.1 TRAP transporter permease [Virgibacillus natechei]